MAHLLTNQTLRILPKETITGFIYLKPKHHGDLNVKMWSTGITYCILFHWLGLWTDCIWIMIFGHDLLVAIVFIVASAAVFVVTVVLVVLLGIIDHRLLGIQFFIALFVLLTIFLPINNLTFWFFSIEYIYRRFYCKSAK